MPALIFCSAWAEACCLSWYRFMTFEMVSFAAKNLATQLAYRGAGKFRWRLYEVVMVHRKKQAGWRWVAVVDAICEGGDERVRVTRVRS